MTMTQSAARLDQEQTEGGFSAPGADHWQSFTAGITGALAQLDLKVGSGLVDEPQDGTIRIYKGEGVDGQLLSEQPVTFDAYPAAWQTFGLHAQPTVVAGGRYSYRFAVPEVDVTWVNLAKPGPYAGGRAGYGPNRDLLFKTYVVPAELDQEQTTGGYGAGSTDQWQSFTAGITGGLVKLDVKVGSGLVDEPQDGTIRIYEGEGVDGRLLSEQPVTFDAYPAAWQAFGLHSPATVVAGKQYTYRLSVPKVDVGWVDHAHGAYAGGRASADPSWDLLFKTYVAPAG